MLDALRAGDPATVAGYVLVGRLGEGGQGVVFLGRSPSGQKVAVKLLHARLAGDAGARVRFTREIAAAKVVAEFSTARVLDADLVGERPFIVTEYVDGPSLQRLVAEGGPCSGDSLARIAVGTATALTAIHHAGIVHRDLKPANVLIGPEGPRVIDFGIARVLDSTATLTSHAVGTPAYMAPEQLSRGPIGPAVDVFAWSAMMVFAATGAPPFGNDTVAAVIRRVLRAEPELADVAEPLRGLLADCLAKDLESRPTIQQVLDRTLAAWGRPPGVRDRPMFAPAGTLVDRARPHDLYGGASADPYATRPEAPGRAPAKRRWWPVAAVVPTAALVGAGVWLLGGDPVKFTTLPVAGCAMVPAAAVQEAAGQPLTVQAATDELNDQGQKIDASCEWWSAGGSSFRQLAIYVSVLRDVPSPVDDDPPKGLDRAKKEQRHDRGDFQDRAGRTQTLGPAPVSVERYGPLHELGGFGDEGFVVSKQVRNADGSFDPRIAYVRVRWGNALVSVAYTAGELPSPHVMTPTAEPVVRRGAETTARELLHYLSACKACTS